MVLLVHLEQEDRRETAVYVVVQEIPAIQDFQEHVVKWVLQDYLV